MAMVMVMDMAMEVVRKASSHGFIKDYMGRY